MVLSLRGDYMKMKFIGKDGSLGYKFGAIYDIKIETIGDYIYVLSEGHLRCPYSSLEKLLENWQEIKGCRFLF